MAEYLFLGSALLSIISGTILFCLNPKRNVNRAFLASSVGIAGWSMCTGLAILAGKVETADPNPHLILWIRASLASGALIGWSAWLTRTAILSENKSFKEVLAKSWVFLVIAAIAATIGVSELYIPSSSTQLNKQRGIGYELYTLLAVSSCLWMLFDSWHHQRKLTGVRRIEMQFFVIGLVCACLLLLISNLLGSSPDFEGVRRLTPLWFVILHFIAVWAVCSHRVFEAKYLILSVGYRICMLCALGGCALLLKPFLASLWGQTLSLFMGIGLAGTTALLIDPQLKRLLQLDRERVLRKPRQMAIDLASRISEEELLREEFSKLLKDLFQTKIVEWLMVLGAPQEIAGLPKHAAHAIIKTVFDEGWITPEALERRRTSPQEWINTVRKYHVGAVTSAPKDGRNPSLVIMFGEKESRRPYTYPDIEIMLDITELMNNLLTQSRAAANAARAEKLAAAAMMSRGLAHDLNNLATPVASFLRHVSSRVAPDSSEAQVLGDAQNALRVMQEYIQESLFFSRELSPNIETISMRQLLNSILRLGESRRASARIRIAAIAPPDLRFAADPALIRRLLQNLVFNAIDASPPGRTIEISAQLDTDQRVVLAVADEGPGVSAGLKEKIFEPYFTTKNTGTRQRGLGLGLAICQKIAELHGAEITVRSREPRGSVFVVTFPPAALKPRQSSVTGLGHISPAAVHEIAPNPTSA